MHKVRYVYIIQKQDAIKQHLTSIYNRSISQTGGIVNILELVYEYLGLNKDNKGQLMMEAIISIIEDNDNNDDNDAQPDNDNNDLKKNEGIEDNDNTKQEECRNNKESKSQGFDDLKYEIYQAEDLKNEFRDTSQPNKYLSIYDLNKDYKYEYLEDYDEDAFNRISKEFVGEKYIGVDTEAHLRVEKATYLQLSTQNFGVIFNIKSRKFRDHPIFKSQMQTLFESEKILKVGHSLRQDARLIKQAFFGETEFNGVYSLEEYLFTAPLKTNKLGLSSMCLRLFGKPLNKDYQSFIGEQESLYHDDEKEYAIMDALAPVVILAKLKKAADTKINRDSFIANCKDRNSVSHTEFLLDHHLELLKVYLEQNNLKFEILKDKTYSGKYIIT